MAVCQLCKAMINSVFHYTSEVGFSELTTSRITRNDTLRQSLRTEGSRVGKAEEPLSTFGESCDLRHL